MPKKKRREPRGRPTTHKYPTTTRDVRSYLIARAPRAILDAAETRARAEQKSLRVVVIDLLAGYARGLIHSQQENP